MCGITGWVDPGGCVEEGALGRMCDRLAHRGPDGRGLWISTDGTAGLGHRRLAIIDLSDAAAQPMWNEGSDIGLVFNGEIYNFGELRRELEGSGHTFHSRTDSEVILHGFEEWGLDELLGRLNGMFAFALWDASRRRLLVVRDRIGIKPLYYAELPGGGLAFASEAKALLEHPRVTRAVDDAGLHGYLAYGYVPHERSIFHGIRKLRPGHALAWQDGRTAVRRWWELCYEPAETAAGRAEIVESIHKQVRDAVRARMVADVPVGSFLSGGVDSSTVTAFCVDMTRDPFDTFCVGFDVGAHDDLHYARLVAGRLAARHHTLEVTGPDARGLLPRLASVMDEPLYDPSTLATWVLAEFARRRVKVALSGTGGDELFAGYGWFASQIRYAARRAALGPLWRPLAGITRVLIDGLRATPVGLRAPGALKLAGRTQPERSFLVRGFFDAGEQRRLLSGGGVRPPAANEHLWVHERTWRPGWPLVPAILNHDLNAFLPDNCLVLLDRTTMAHGLEARVPLLDHRLVEAVFRLPWEQISSGDGDKRLLKEAVTGLVPGEVLSRPKAGFSPPFKIWLREGELEELYRGLLGGALAADGVIAPAFVEALLRQRALRRWNKLWLLLNLEAWYRTWIRGEPAGDGTPHGPEGS